jgi:hypothetical protein
VIQTLAAVRVVLSSVSLSQVFICGKSNQAVLCLEAAVNKRQAYPIFCSVPADLQLVRWGTALAMLTRQRLGQQQGVHQAGLRRQQRQAIPRSILATFPLWVAVLVPLERVQQIAIQAAHLAATDWRRHYGSSSNYWLINRCYNKEEHKSNNSSSNNSSNSKTIFTDWRCKVERTVEISTWRQKTFQHYREPLRRVAAVQAMATRVYHRLVLSLC